MAKLTEDIEKKLSFMGLDSMSRKLDEMERDPGCTSLSKEQFLSELVDYSHAEYFNTMLERSLRLSRLRGKGGDIENLYTHDGRVYSSDAIVEQVKTLEFIKDGRNVCVFGASDSGKTYS